MQARVEILSAADAEALFALRRQALIEAPLAFLATPDDDIASSVEATRELLQSGSPSTLFGARDGRLVGMVGLHRERRLKVTHKAHIWGMYVRPEARRQRLGERLLAAAVEHARGLEGVRWLHISVSDAAPEAKRLYERSGFEVWGIEPEALNHEGQGVHEYRMAMSLA